MVALLLAASLACLRMLEVISCPEGNPGSSCTPDHRTAVHVLKGGKYVAR
jgi:hypothetical protein